MFKKSGIAKIDGVFNEITSVVEKLQLGIAKNKKQIEKGEAKIAKIEAEKVEFTDSNAKAQSLVLKLEDVLGYDVPEPTEDEVNAAIAEDEANATD